jgi:hypothetical protein
MSFKDQINADLLHAVRAEEFGESGAWYRYVGEPEENDTEVAGIFDRESLMVDPETGAQVISTAPTFWMPSTQLKRNPKVGDKLIIRSDVYSFPKPPQDDGTGLMIFNLHKERIS